MVGTPPRRERTIDSAQGAARLQRHVVNALHRLPSAMTPEAPGNRRALGRGDLAALRAAAAELPGLPPLEDALAICLLLLDQEPQRYERAAVRWLGRLLLERRAMTLRQAEYAAASLAACRDPTRREDAAEHLGELVRRPSLATGPPAPLS
jgi:hypothetical protein